MGVSNLAFLLIDRCNFVNPRYSDSMSYMSIDSHPSKLPLAKATNSHHHESLPRPPIDHSRTEASPQRESPWNSLEHSSEYPTPVCYLAHFPKPDIYSIVKA